MPSDVCRTYTPFSKYLSVRDVNSNQKTISSHQKHHQPLTQMAMFNRMNPQDDENNKYNNLMNTNMNKNMNMKIHLSSSLISLEDDTEHTRTTKHVAKINTSETYIDKSPNRAKNYKQLAIILGGIGSQWNLWERN